MSRLDYDDTEIVYETHHSVHLPLCTYCNSVHVRDEIGLTMHKYNAWFCSGACMTMYQYDNKIVLYSPDTVKVLEEMRRKFYSKERKYRRYN